MKLSDFDYNLPNDLIATYPVSPRDCSRLLVLDKNTGDIEHKHFFDVIDFLNKGDLLVFNNSQVIPARLIGKKQKTGGKVEVFLHKRNFKQKEKEVWECLLKGKNIKEEMIIEFSDDFFATVVKKNKDGTYIVIFNKNKQDFIKQIEKIGKIPLPPYIEKNRVKSEFKNTKIDDKECYQTVYADVEKKGSVAAPTAGLHFTDELLQKIKSKGVNFEYITLHVGMGTFLPVKTDNILEHKMHSEWVEVKNDTIKKIMETKKRGGRIITVGTTSTRALEAIFLKDKNLNEKDYTEWVDIFIYPGYKFKIVDAIITNFHLPKSTLLMLVSAFSSEKKIKKAYQQAIKNKYRFYSYGDVMLIS